MSIGRNGRGVGDNLNKSWPGPVRCNCMSQPITLFSSPRSCLPIWIGIPVVACASHRTSLPKSDTAEAQEATHLVHAHANLRTGKAFPQAKVLGLGRTGHTGQVVEDDRCSSENMASVNNTPSAHCPSGLIPMLFVLFLPLPLIRFQNRRTKWR